MSIFVDSRQKMEPEFEKPRFEALITLIGVRRIYPNWARQGRPLTGAKSMSYVTMNSASDSATAMSQIFLRGAHHLVATEAGKAVQSALLR